MAFLEQLFSTADLTPHGFCLYWRPDLLLLQVIPDALIGLSYYSIPLALAYFVSRRADIAFGWIFWLFAAFILACGTTHWVEIWTLWHPDYATQGLIKGLTAAISILTAILLWPLLPRALALPSPLALRQVNEQLSVQIRERDRAAEALQRETLEHRRTEEMLRQSQKMEAIGQLTGGIAHDFNNLLTVVIGNVALLAQRAQSADPFDHEIRTLAAAAMRGADRAARLTQQLLAFSRRQALHPERTDLNRLVAGAVELWRRTLGERVEIAISPEAGLWPVLVDRHQLENVLLNLILNARDAMPAGGRITLATANAAIAAPRATPYGEIAPGDYVTVSVSDTGVGMTREILEKATEPFFTTKEVGRGSGLGLSMSFGFARQSEGYLDIDSEPGRGTIVRLYLRRDTTSVVDRDEPTSTVAELPQAKPGETVLVVEDDPDVRDYTCRLIAEWGYRVVGAGDGIEALAKLEGEPQIDLLLTDIGLPGMNGHALAKAARQRNPRLPVLMTSGYDNSEFESDRRPEHAEPVLLKPFTPAELAREMRRLIDLASQRQV